MPSTGGDLVYDSRLGAWVVKTPDGVIFQASQSGSIADAATNHDATDNATALKGYVDDLGETMNEVLAALRKANIIRE